MQTLSKRCDSHLGVTYHLPCGLEEQENLVGRWWVIQCAFTPTVPREAVRARRQRCRELPRCTDDKHSQRREINHRTVAAIDVPCGRRDRRLNQLDEFGTVINVSACTSPGPGWPPAPRGAARPRNLLGEHGSFRSCEVGLPFLLSLLFDPDGQCAAQCDRALSPNATAIAIPSALSKGCCLALDGRPFRDTVRLAELLQARSGLAGESKLRPEAHSEDHLEWRTTTGGARYHLALKADPLCDSAATTDLASIAAVKATIITRTFIASLHSAL